MKNLYERNEEKWTFTSYAELTGITRRVVSPTRIVLLLHGLGERGKRIYRKLFPYLPEDALIIAPNAPFPIPKEKDNRLDFGHSWYFYDKFTTQYYQSQEISSHWLRDVIRMENPGALPVFIIGFSQGGYLAPYLAQKIKETQLVIGLCCEFRSSQILENPSFELFGIHGNEDKIVNPMLAKEEIYKLNQRGIKVDFELLPHLGHDISAEMGKLIKLKLEQYGKRGL